MVRCGWVGRSGRPRRCPRTGRCPAHRHARAAVDPRAGPRLRRDRGGRAAAVRRLVEHGHDVTLFAPPDSTSSADVQPLLDDDASRRDRALPLVRPTTSRAPSPRSTPPRPTGPFDVVHDHTGYVALAMADRARARRSCTRCTGPFDEATPALLRDARPQGDARGHQPRPAPRTRRPRPARCAVVHNPLRFDEWPFGAEKRRPRPVGRAHGARQGPAPRDRRGARRRACRSCSPGPCSRARRSSSPRRSSRTSTATRSATWARSARTASAALYGARARTAHADPLAGAVRHGHGRGDGLRHAGDRLPGGLGAGGRDRRGDRASWSTTRTRWRGDRRLGEIDRAALPASTPTSASASRRSVRRLRAGLRPGPVAAAAAGRAVVGRPPGTLLPASPGAARGRVASAA